MPTGRFGRLDESWPMVIHFNRSAHISKHEIPTWLTWNFTQLLQKENDTSIRSIAVVCVYNSRVHRPVTEVSICHCIERSGNAPMPWRKPGQCHFCFAVTRHAWIQKHLHPISMPHAPIELRPTTIDDIIMQWCPCSSVALRLHLATELGLPSSVKTTGRRGVFFTGFTDYTRHVWLKKQAC